MAQVTFPPILDSTGQAIVDALDGIADSLHRSGVKAQYDETPALYAHAVDDIIYFDSIFYKVTQAIAVGDTLTIGTNIVAANLSEDTPVYVEDLPGGGGGGGSTKFPSSIQPSVSNVTLDWDTRSATVSLTVVGDGTLSAVSSDSNIATSLNGTTLTISKSELGTLSGTVTVSISETENYLSAQTTISVTDTTIALKTFAAATDAEIVDMVALADAGEIDLYEHAGWRVGDERSVSLAAIASSGTYDGVSWSVGESQSAQTVTMVLMHQGQYELVTPVKDTSGQNRTTCSFVVGLKNSLSTRGYMNSTNTNNGSWQAAKRRNWCNGGFRQAINSTLKPIFKQFNCISGIWDGSSGGGSNITTQDYFALPAEKEIFGSKTYSTDNEATALSQFTWYATTSNRVKNQGDTGSAYLWWERSPYNGEQLFCCVSTDGTANCSFAGSTFGISPFGCI